MASLMAAPPTTISGQAFPVANQTVNQSSPTMADSTPLFALKAVVDLILRASAVAMLTMNVLMWLLVLRKKQSSLRILVGACIGTYLVGVLCTMLPKIQAAPNSPILTIGVGVGCFMFSYEVFNWVLYLRFSIITAFERRLRIATLIWLGLESLAAGANYIFWVYESVTKNESPGAEKMFTFLSVVQAVTAFYLSTYFVVNYYLPMLRQNRQGVSLFTRFFTTGFLYLCAETLLHCTFTITSNFAVNYRSGITALVTAIRYNIFILFILALRREYNQSASFTLSPPHVRRPNRVLDAEHLQQVGVKGTFDDWVVDESVTPVSPTPPPAAFERENQKMAEVRAPEPRSLGKLREK
ncbi:uncharacterized protein SPPG_02861 [Spizellomyces punctatus DAOM BR117]|uniref:Uncharacterized protein n=1 Tax=Spizellomyces punctatus (strain DAOM BR117) TaxID=645134 RepID=A0A0L0HMR8_SPIPD|nr:uncharacterized protein SPPG_02861 [Spizellomyces punctatus DAOM BR117]KND02392.1 hypothetical protein SPPG_02861 [Spizellomyces punctatus DAOM BR117]|eukprot:XP_016610431.1 hypothetical protein SPPG_02861 [Spizellomyces punctatus DAOM BR117]